MRHVCHVIFDHRVLDARIFYKEAVSLARNGYQVTVLCPQRRTGELGRRGDITMPPDGTYEQEGVRFTGYAYNKKLPALFGLRDRSTLKALLEAIKKADADIYHFHEDGITMEAAAMVKELLPGKSLVFDFHESYLHTYRYNRKKVKRLRHYLGLEEKIIRDADLVIGSSDFITEYYRTLLVRKAVTVMNCQSEQVFGAGTLAGDDGAFMVVHEGRMLFNRGLKLLLEAARLVEEEAVRFLIVGSLHKKEQVYFDRFCAKHGLRERFEVTGWLPYGEVPARLCQGKLGITFLLTPNAWTGLPLKFFNYLRYAQPVLSLPHPLISPLIREKGIGVECGWGDAAGAAERIDELCRNPEQYRTLSRNAERLFRTEYNWENMEARLLEAYAGLQD